MTNVKRMHRQALKAMREAVEKIVIERRKNEIPLSIWKNGKVAQIAAKDVNNPFEEA